MSIIYDALQKTQQRVTRTEFEKPRKRRNVTFWIDVGIVFMIVFLSFMVVIEYTPHMFSQKEKEPVINEADLAKNLIINGVFLSDTEKTALINNQSYHLGETVNGMKIVSMDLNSVTFQKDQQTVTLRTAG